MTQTADRTIVSELAAIPCQREGNPASFLLAHFGGEAASGDLSRATWAILGLGLVTGLPLLWVATRQKPEKENR